MSNTRTSSSTSETPATGSAGMTLNQLIKSILEDKEIFPEIDYELDEDIHGDDFPHELFFNKFLNFYYSEDIIRIDALLNSFDQYEHLRDRPEAFSDIICFQLGEIVRLSKNDPFLPALLTNIITPECALEIESASVLAEERLINRTKEVQERRLAALKRKEMEKRKEPKQKKIKVEKEDRKNKKLIDLIANFWADSPSSLNSHKEKQTLNERTIPSSEAILTSSPPPGAYLSIFQPPVQENENECSSTNVSVNSNQSKPVKLDAMDKVAIDCVKICNDFIFTSSTAQHQSSLFKFPLTDEQQISLLMKGKSDSLNELYDYAKSLSCMMQQMFLIFIRIKSIRSSTVIAKSIYFYFDMLKSHRTSMNAQGAFCSEEERRKFVLHLHVVSMSLLISCQNVNNKMYLTTEFHDRFSAVFRPVIKEISAAFDEPCFRGGSERRSRRMGIIDSAWTEVGRVLAIYAQSTQSVAPKGSGELQSDNIREKRF